MRSTCLGNLTTKRTMLKSYWSCFSSSDGYGIYNVESCKGTWWLRWPMWHLTSSLDSTFVFFGVKHLSELTRNVKLEKGFLRWPNQNTNTKLEKVNKNNSKMILFARSSYVDLNFELHLLITGLSLCWFINLLLLSLLFRSLRIAHAVFLEFS